MAQIGLQVLQRGDDQLADGVLRVNLPLPAEPLRHQRSPLHRPPDEPLVDPLLLVDGHEGGLRPWPAVVRLPGQHRPALELQLLFRDAQLPQHHSCQRIRSAILHHRRSLSVEQKEQKC